MNDREIELIDYLRVLWRQKWIVLATVIAAVLAAWGASNIAESYRVKLDLLILAPSVSESSSDGFGLHLGKRTYEEIATSSSVLASTHAKIGSDSELGNLRDMLSVSVESLTGSGQNVEQYLVSATLTRETPESLTILATAWSEAFSDAVSQIFQDREIGTLAHLESSYSQAKSDLEKLTEERLVYTSHPPLVVLRVRRDSLRSELVSTYAQMADVLSEKDLLAAYRAVGITGLAERSPSTQIVMDNLSPTRLISALVLGLSLADFGTMIDQRADALEKQVGIIETELASVDEEIDTLTLALDGFNREISVLQDFTTLLAAEIQLARVSLASAHVQITGLSSQLTPEMSRPSGTVRMNLIIAAFLGVFVGLLLAFFVDYLFQVRIRENSQAAAADAKTRLLEEKAAIAEDSVSATQE